MYQSIFGQSLTVSGAFDFNVDDLKSVIFLKNDHFGRFGEAIFFMEKGAILRFVDFAKMAFTTRLEGSHFRGLISTSYFSLCGIG
jgi:hypothetical protein